VAASAAARAAAQFHRVLRRQRPPVAADAGQRPAIPPVGTAERDLAATRGRRAAARGPLVLVASRLQCLGAAARRMGHLRAASPSAGRLHHHHAARPPAVGAGYAHAAGQAAAGRIRAASRTVLLQARHPRGLPQRRALRRQRAGRGRRQPRVFRQAGRRPHPAGSTDAGGDPAGTVASVAEGRRAHQPRVGAGPQRPLRALAAQASARCLAQAAVRFTAHPTAVGQAAVRGAARGGPVDRRATAERRAPAAARRHHHRPRPAAWPRTAGGELRAAQCAAWHLQRGRAADRHP